MEQAYALHVVFIVHCTIHFSVGCARYIVNKRYLSMTRLFFFRLLQNDRLAPAEEEIADSQAEHGRQTQPRVEGHYDEHEGVGQAHLDKVPQRLE